MKRLISLALATAMAFTLCACNTDKASPAEAAVEKEYMWVAKPLPLPGGMEYVTAQYVAGDKIYVGGMGLRALFGVVNSDGSCELFDLDPGYEYIYAVCAAEDGIAVLAGTLPPMYTREDGTLLMEPEGKLSLIIYSAQGKVMSETPLAEIYDENQMNFKIIEYFDGSFFLVCPDYLMKIAPDGEELSRIACGENDFYMSLCTADGKLLLCEEAGGFLGGNIYEVNPDDLSLSALYSTESYPLTGLGSSADGRLITVCRDGTCSIIDPADGKREEFLNLNEFGVDDINIRTVSQFGGGYIFYATFMENIVYIDYVEDSSNKLELTVGAMDGDTRVLYKLVNSFNAHSPDIRVKVQTYASADCKVLQGEIAAGNGPDIYFVSANSIVMQAVRQENVYEDLLPYLDADPEYGRETIVPQLFDAICDGERLYMLPYGFEIDTFTAPESVVGDGRLTLKELDAIIEARGRDELVFPKWVTQSQLFSWMSRFAFYQFVDKESGQCSFDSPAFQDLLTICRDYATPNGSDTSGNSHDCLYINCPLQALRLVAVKSWSSNGDYSFAGFPTTAYNGSSFCLRSEFAINSRGEHKDEAWEFLRYTMSSPAQSLFSDDTHTGIPSTVDGLEAEIARLLRTGVDMPSGHLDFTQADADKFMKLLEETEIIEGDDYPAMEILRDDAERYFAGAASLDEVTRSMNSRVEIYLAEKG